MYPPIAPRRLREPLPRCDGAVRPLSRGQLDSKTRDSCGDSRDDSDRPGELLDGAQESEVRLLPQQYPGPKAATPAVRRRSSGRFLGNNLTATDKTPTVRHMTRRSRTFARARPSGQAAATLPPASPLAKPHAQKSHRDQTSNSDLRLYQFIVAIRERKASRRFALS